MITCRKCGAENLASAKFCQMCANPLAMTDSPPGDRAAKSSSPSLATTVVFSAESPGALVCSVCDGVNDPDWAFCQQCGSKLGVSSEPDPRDEVVSPKQQQVFPTTVQSSTPVNKLDEGSRAAHVACPKCSQPVFEGAAFCYKCGAAIASSSTVVMSSLRPSRKARLLLIVDGEATGDEYELKGDTAIGRINGDITFPHDDYMSGCHARIARRGEKFMLIDEDSRNGSFIRIKKEVEIQSGDLVLLGKQLFRFEV